jgi:hypothetical protein
LVLTTFRPGYQARWMETATYRQAALTLLGDAAADELLRDLLRADLSLDGLAELIRERRGGHPFSSKRSSGRWPRAGRSRG